jgi:CRP-like cAMP-binding protein
MAQVDENIIDLLARSSASKRFSTGEIVFSEGDDATFLPTVRSGRVKMVRYPELGKEVIVGTFGAGEIFAIPPALDGKAFPATAVAMEDSELLFMPRFEFKALMDRSAEFSAVILEQMCGILRQKADTVRILATPSAEQRIAGILLGIVGDMNGTGPVRIDHRRQDIADMAGLTIETTIRSIRRMAARDMFRIVHGKIYIDSLDPLRRLSE